MTFLPIVERELRVASRRRGTYFTRCGSAIGALFIGGWMMLAMQEIAPQSLGKSLFVTMAVITMLSAASGLRSTVDCLSEEKRDGTLGLLFLTDLKGYDVVFGKLVSSSLASAYAMLAIFPILAISLLLGGVTYAEFGRVALTSANILFLSLSIGLFCSAICRDERKAMSLAVLILLLLIFTAPLAGLLLAIRQNNNRFEELWWMVFLLPSPGYGCALSFDMYYRMLAESYWYNLAIVHLYSWLFLAMACRIVPRSWQDKASTAKREEMESGWKTATQGTSGERRDYRRHLLDINAFFWLAARDRLKMKLTWGFMICAAALWLWGWIEFKKDWLNPGTYIITALALHGILKFWVATEGCKRFVEDRRSGAMELMLSTPMTPDEIFHGQRLALLRQFGKPAAIILAVDFILLLAGMTEIRDQNGKVVWGVVWVVGATIFIMDLLALSWVSMWAGLTAHRANKAAGTAASRILAVPWVVFCVLTSGVAILDSIIGFRAISSSDFSGTFIVLVWFGISVANNIFWTSLAKNNLRTRFREIATERFTEPPSFWAKIFRMGRKAGA